MSLKQLASELADVATASENTYEDAMEAASRVLQALEDDDPELDDALRILLAAIRAEDTERAGIGAIVCGSLVERGADPALAGEHIVERFVAVSKKAIEYVAACRDYFEENIVSDDAICEVCGPGDDETDVMMPDVRAEVSVEMPEGESAWVALDLFCRPTVTLLSRLPALRRQFGQDLELINRAGLLAQHQPSAYYVWALLSVLDDEELLVIDPAGEVGFDVTISGVGDNFQLHVLLADALYGDGHLEGDEPPDPAVVRAMSGEGPPTVDDFVIGYWNLYNWHALSAEGDLPDGYFDQGQRYWIWNEGVPADIERFEGRRVVLLGPSPFVRQWQPLRLFEAMSATLDVERVLPQQEVRDWLERLCRASADLREAEDAAENFESKASETR